MLYCKKLEENAKLPTVAHAGEDLGYDVYALEDTILFAGKVSRIKTGIAARFIDDNAKYQTLGGNGPKIETIFGLLFKDRSSMAAKGLTVSGGVIDAGFTGPLTVLLTNNNGWDLEIKAGDKIVQMLPIPVYTSSGVADWLDELPVSKRSTKGFGSSDDIKSK